MEERILFVLAELIRFGEFGTEFHAELIGRCDLVADALAPFAHGKNERSEPSGERDAEHGVGAHT